MIKNLSEYFLPEQQFYLHKLTYERIESGYEKENCSLNCTDNISVEFCDSDMLKILVTRNLVFDPSILFSLSVSFGADIKFDPQKKEEYEWEKINLADEFRDYGDFVTANLMNRISLLISQITSSFGQMPLVLAPYIVKSNNIAKEE